MMTDLENNKDLIITQYYYTYFNSLNTFFAEDY